MSNKDIMSEVDIDKIIKGSVVETIKDHSPEEKLEESYHADTKPFKQVSELVSQRTKTAHIELYNDYVEKLNRISAELDTADRSNVNSKHSEFRSLKLDETYNLNSVWLHELYFANCFDPHSEIEMDSIAFLKLQASFGDFETWQRDFMACGLAVGQGWVVCGYHTFLRRYVNVMVSYNSQDVMIGVYPLIVVDMHDHACNRDYGNDKKSYLVAMMREINWSVVGERFTRAERIAQVVK